MGFLRTFVGGWVKKKKKIVAHSIFPFTNCIKKNHLKKRESDMQRALPWSPYGPGVVGGGQPASPSYLCTIQK